MGKMKLPSGQKIMLDTAPLIYYIENIEPYASSLQSLFDAISTGRNMAVTSVVTLIEVLTKPIQEKATWRSSFECTLRVAKIWN